MMTGTTVLGAGVPVTLAGESSAPRASVWGDDMVGKTGDVEGTSSLEGICGVEDGASEADEALALLLDNAAAAATPAALLLLGTPIAGKRYSLHQFTRPGPVSL